jgi:hypothetical protein
MARKNIFDIVSKSQIEPWRMYQRVYNLFYCNDVMSPEFGYTTVCDEVDRAFRYFPYTFRHGAITLEDFNHTYNYFFSEYVTEEESNKNPSTVEEFLIKGITLMKISNHGVVQYVEGEEDITNTLS